MKFHSTRASDKSSFLFAVLRKISPSFSFKSCETMKDTFFIGFPPIYLAYVKEKQIVS